MSSSMPPILPVLTNYEGDDLEDAEVEEDQRDEQHVMALLHKLKIAKTCIDTSRQKKRAKNLLEEAASRFSSDSDELLKKHNKRWAAKLGVLHQKSKKIRRTIEDTLKQWEEQNEDCKRRLEYHESKLQHILLSMDELAKELQTNKTHSHARMETDLNGVRTQVSDRLKQVQVALVKTHARCSKDDKFTKMIKTFLTSY